MIRVDTSVWVDHLQAGDESLAALLNGSQVLMLERAVDRFEQFAGY